jgi:hypothetical protein
LFVLINNIITHIKIRRFSITIGQSSTYPIDKEGNNIICFRKKDSDFLPDIDDTFKPSGAVTEMYGGKQSFGDRDMTLSNTIQLNNPQESKDKFCIECGFKLKANSKFCTRCGTKQE